MKLIDRVVRNIRNLFRKKEDMRMRNAIIEYNLAYAIVNKKLKKRVNTHILDYNPKTEFLCVDVNDIMYLPQPVHYSQNHETDTISLSFSNRPTYSDDDSIYTARRQRSPIEVSSLFDD